METTFFEWIVGQAGLAGIAGFALYMLNQVWKQRLAEQCAQREREREALERQAERERADKLLLIDALNRNTEAIAAFRETMERFEKR